MNYLDNYSSDMTDHSFVVRLCRELLTNIRHICLVTCLFGFTSVSAQYELPTVEVTPLGSSSTLRVGDNVEIAKFRLSNRGDKNLLVERITFRNYGRADLEETLVGPYISVNNEAVTHEVAVDRKEVTFVFAYDGFELERGSSVIMRVMSTIGYAESRDTIELAIRRQEDIRAIDPSSGFYAPTTADNVRFGSQTLRPGSIYTSGYSSRGARYYGSRANYSSQSYVPTTTRTSTSSNYNYGSVMPYYWNRMNPALNDPSVQTTTPTSTYASRYRSNYRPTYRSSYTPTQTSTSSTPVTRLRTTERDTYSPGSRDIVFLHRTLHSNRNFTVDGIFFPMDSNSFAIDKDGNGVNNEISDFDETFGEFTLYVNDQREASASGLDQLDNQIGVWFANDMYFDGGYNNIKVVGRIGRAAQNGDRLRLKLSDRNFIRLEYQ